jgi:hypothetical protein
MGTTVTGESFNEVAGDMGHEFVSPITMANEQLSDKSGDDDDFD